MNGEDKRFFGKYRGTVLNNIDPMQIGRLLVTVPDVSNVAPSSWAMPCLPVGGRNMGLFSVPPIGSGVWIEFEQGDSDYPIWVGCFWGSTDELPSLSKTVPPSVAGITLQSSSGHGLVISDLPGAAGGVLLQSATGAKISVSDTGIQITNGKGAMIDLTGATVDVNSGALKVV